nr:60S ribosome subunit biogenesis protein NIP7 homolog [Ipomoea batatas]GME21571.1 60S ribosome subunit biogenesis protein NIP7 homolog [Ipomoea batatas]
MRALDENETTQVFEKLYKFVGNNLKNIVESPSHEGPDTAPGRYCFRLQTNRVYYVSESLVKRATNIKRDNLISLGTQIGKFTKGGVGRITENVSEHDGVVVFSMSDVPLGFGVAAKSTQDCRKLDPNGIVVLHQADIGEYLRMEDEL